MRLPGHKLGVDAEPGTLHLVPKQRSRHIEWAVPADVPSFLRNTPSTALPIRAAGPLSTRRRKRCGASSKEARGRLRRVAAMRHEKGWSATKSKGTRGLAQLATPSRDLCDVRSPSTPRKRAAAPRRPPRRSRGTAHGPRPHSAFGATRGGPPNPKASSARRLRRVALESSVRRE